MGKKVKKEGRRYKGKMSKERMGRVREEISKMEEIDGRKERTGWHRNRKGRREGNNGEGGKRVDRGKEKQNKYGVKKGII